MDNNIKDYIKNLPIAGKHLPKNIDLDDFDARKYDTDAELELAVFEYATQTYWAVDMMLEDGDIIYADPDTVNTEQELEDWEKELSQSLTFDFEVETRYSNVNWRVTFTYEEYQECAEHHERTYNYPLKLQRTNLVYIYAQQKLSNQGRIAKLDWIVDFKPLGRRPDWVSLCAEQEVA